MKGRRYTSNWEKWRIIQNILFGAFSEHNKLHFLTHLTFILRNSLQLLFVCELLRLLMVVHISVSSSPALSSPICFMAVLSVICRVLEAHLTYITLLPFFTIVYVNIFKTSYSTIVSRILGLPISLLGKPHRLSYSRCGGSFLCDGTSVSGCILRLYSRYAVSNTIVFSHNHILLCSSVRVLRSAWYCHFIDAVTQFLPCNLCLILMLILFAKFSGLAQAVVLLSVQFCYGFQLSVSRSVSVNYYFYLTDPQYNITELTVRHWYVKKTKWTCW
jgi:hypothetical protein